MSLRSPAEHENADLRHAGMGLPHPDLQGCFWKHPCKPGFQHSMLE
jgi:hypothetical protein